MFHNLLSFGDIIELRVRCNPEKLLKEIKEFEWVRYNPRKQINRYGLSVTSLDGDLSGIPDLDSTYEYNEIHGTTYTNMSFKEFTDVYWQSSETRKLIEPFKPWIGRTHFLNFKMGGFFPPHIDWRSIKEADCFRLLVPISDCNPERLFFIYEKQPLYFRYGSAYFMNTNKVHSVFSFSDEAKMLVMNIENTEESAHQITKMFRYK